MKPLYFPFVTTSDDIVKMLLSVFKDIKISVINEAVVDFPGEVEVVNPLDETVYRRAVAACNEYQRAGQMYGNKWLKAQKHMPGEVPYRDEN